MQFNIPYIVVTLKGGVNQLDLGVALEVDGGVLLVWPVLIGLYLLALHQLGHHDDQLHLLFHHHLPEMSKRFWLWCLAGDEGLLELWELDPTCVYIVSLSGTVEQGRLQGNVIVIVGN